MKYKEFVKNFKEMSFEVFNEDDYYTIEDKYERAVATVNKYVCGQICTDYVGWGDLCYNAKIKILNILVEFAATPIEDREEEKKFYLRHKFLCDNADMSSFDVYLNYRIKDNCYFIYDSSQNEDVKTQFTLKEIEKIEDKFNTNLDDFELIEVK